MVRGAALELPRQCRRATDPHTHAFVSALMHGATRPAMHAGAHAASDWPAVLVLWHDCPCPQHAHALIIAFCTTTT